MKKIFAFVILSVSILSAQSAYEFLRLDMSPRAAALAGSFVANNDDPNVMFYNPAGINLLQGTPISFSFLKHLEDVNSASLAASKDFEGIGKLSAAIQYISYGSFVKADAQGNNLGEFSAGDMALTVGYGNQLDANFYYGANVKIIYSKIDEVSSAAAAIDFGLHYAFPESKWNLGFSVLNLGAQVSSYFDTKEELPLDVRFGLSKQLENLPFKFFFSINKINQDQEKFLNHFSQVTFGGEFKLGQSLRLRFGYDNEKRKELKVSSTGGLAGFNLGVGFMVKTYNIDYAFSSLGYIGAMHRFGISTNL